MANHASLLSPSFFIIFLPEFHGNGTLKFPKHFVKEHWESFSKEAYLEVPTGEKFEMKLKMRNGRAWLDKGRGDFVHNYSIKYGYLLVFRYQGRSSFIVQIFDLSTEQIKYANTSHQKEVDFVIKEEEECDIEDCPIGMEMANQSNTGKLEIGQNSSSVETNLQREKTAWSRNPKFSVTMKPTYVTNRLGSCYMHIPKHAASYFHLKGKDDIFLSLNGENGKIWHLKYYAGTPPYYLARIRSGWRDFFEENNLKEGDVCTFEAVSSKDMIFKVTISRKNDEQVDKRRKRSMSDVVSPRGIRNRKSTAMKCNETSFAVTMSKTNVGARCRLDIPRAHSARHLHDQHGKEVFLRRLDGETWRFKCCNIGAASRFYNGWRGFVTDNELQMGDTCVFELSSKEPNHYKVSIFSGLSGPN